jgi:hypothetical protein
MSHLTDTWDDCSPVNFWRGEAPPNSGEVPEYWPLEPKPQDKKTLRARVRDVLSWGKPEPSIEGPHHILNDLTKLLAAEDYNEYVLKPRPGAYLRAKEFVLEADRRLERGLPMPRVALDGNGGIILEWRNDRGVVKLGFASTGDNADNYIFYMSGELYRTIEATAENLIERLEWLNHE